MSINKELKLKAKIKDVDSIRKNIKKLALFLENDISTDYFFKKNSGEETSELRLRKLEFKKEITLKIIIKRDYLQENVEYTFNVDNANDFTNFLEFIGYKPSCFFKKRSEKYSYGKINIEIVNIDKIGNFVEIIMHKKDDFTEQDKNKLIMLAKKIGIDNNNLDSRYYSCIKEEELKDD